MYIAQIFCKSECCCCFCKFRGIASTCGWTPFDGMKTKGWPVATILRGRIVMRDFASTGSADGKPVRFVETLEPA